MLSENKTSPEQPDFLPSTKASRPLFPTPKRVDRLDWHRNGSLHLEHQKFRLDVSIRWHGDVQAVQRIDQHKVLPHGPSRDLPNHIVMIGVPLVKNVNETLRGCDVNAFTSRD